MQYTKRIEAVYDRIVTPAYVGRVIDRLKATLHCETDRELAQRLDISQSMISHWKRRSSLPFKLLMIVAIEHEVSMDWLLFGREGSGLTNQ